MKIIENEFEKFKKKVTNENVQKCREISIWITKQVDFDNASIFNHRLKEKDQKKLHPIRPQRGEVFMAEMGCNVGVEFKDYHPVLIIQNDKGNNFGDTTIVLPITDCDEDFKFNYFIHEKITNDNFESVVKNGLDKNPSVVKLADITTIDKARLNTKIGKVTPEFMKTINIKMKKLLNFY